MAIEREVMVGRIVLKRSQVKLGENFDSDSGKYGIWWLADRRIKRVSIVGPNSVGVITEWENTVKRRGFGEPEIIERDRINGINVPSRMIPGVSYRLRYRSEVSSK